LKGPSTQNGYTFSTTAGLELEAAGASLFAAAPGATAQYLSGNFTTATDAAVTDLADIASDGATVVTLQSGGTHGMHRLAPPGFATTGAPCLAKSSSTQVAVFGAASAWIENNPAQLRFGLHGSGCTPGLTIALGSAGSVAWAVGMLSETKALAFSALGGGNFSAAIYDRGLSSPYLYGVGLSGHSGSGISANPRIAMSPKFALVHSVPGLTGTPFLIQL
nr:hypothetical protein [Polyangiaceae bacterium]